MTALGGSLHAPGMTTEAAVSEQMVPSEPSGVQRPVPLVVLGAAAVVALVVGLVIGNATATTTEASPQATGNNFFTTSTTTPSADTSPTTTSSTTTTTTEPEPEPQPGSREDPLAVGTPFELNGARVTVTSVDLDADSWLVDVHERNQPAEPGMRHVVIHRTVENIGHSGFTAWTNPSLTAVGSEYFSTLCTGVYQLPDAIIYEPMIFPGGTAQGNVCELVPEAEIESGEFLLQFRGEAGQSVYLAP